MLRSLLIGSFMYLGLMQVGWAYAVRADIAIDAVSGEIFVLNQVNNPKGEIQIKSQNENTPLLVLQINRDGSDQQQTQYEIEVLGPGRLAFLISEPHQWTVSEFRKDPSNRWVQIKEELKGLGYASQLERLMDGNLTLHLQKKFFDKDSRVLVIESSNRLQLVDEVKLQDLNSTLTKMSLPKTKNTKSADSDTFGATGNGFGVTAGLISGIGLSYRRFFDDTHGLQVAGIAFGDQDDFHYNIGAQYLHAIHRSQKARFYGLIGTSTYYSGFTNYYYEEPYDPTNPQAIEEWSSERFYNFGAGIGMEVKLGAVGVALELPMTVQFKDDSQRDSGLQFESVYPIPSMSVIYYLPRKK